MPGTFLHFPVVPVIRLGRSERSPQQLLIIFRMNVAISVVYPV